MRRAIYVLAVIGGVAAGVGGLAFGLMLGLLATSAGGRGAPVLQQATFALAAPVVGLGCGAILVWAGLTALGGTAGKPLALPGWRQWLFALLIVIAAGQALLMSSPGVRWTLPVFHVLAGVLSAFLFLAIATAAARAQGAVISARGTLGSLAWGALGGGTIAVLAELVLAVLGGLLIAVWLAATHPELMRQLQDWVLRLSEMPGRIPDFSQFSGIASSPVVIGAILAGLGFFVPLIEESAKSLAVPIVALTGRRLSRLDGFLLGAASGAGFTLLEGILNGSLALADPRSWWFAMLLRSGTAALHCLATGLGGLAWQQALVERRGWRAGALALAALGVHGAWNVMATFSALLGLAGAGGSALALRTAAQVAAAFAMALIWLGVVAALPLLSGYLAGHGISPTPAAESDEGAPLE
ncbi:MAG TPA: PrsW family glutamic-type intramembrane protease [Anaerolineae bacterium]